MNVLFVSPEVSPIVRTGGLGDVVGSLPRIVEVCIDVKSYALFTGNAKVYPFNLEKVISINGVIN